MPTAHIASIPMVARLVSFDTTSRNSNLALIEFVRDYLADLGVSSDLIPDETGRKANLYATLGPADRPGVALSAHTDVVPVDGQDWSADPFQARVEGERLYGRGTADMKSFLGVCLALAPEILEADPATPVHFALTYDEEVGCVGAGPLLAWLAERAVRPAACIVGEPTGMRVVRAHKGKRAVRCRVRGRACHSSVLHRGVNAVEVAAETIAHLKRMAVRFREEGPCDAAFDPPYSTLHTGVVRGGTALNIVPEHCSFEFELRHLPEHDPESVEAEVKRYVDQEILPPMRALAGEAGFAWEPLIRVAGLDTAEESEVVRLARALGGGGPPTKVSFGTEAGLYQRAGIPAVVCGPGRIEQAHTADEFIELEQIARCESFVRSLAARLAGR